MGRSVKKGPFVDSHLERRIDALNAANDKKVIRTWGLSLHLVCTLGSLPVAFALTGAKADERQTLLDILAADPHCCVSVHGRA